MEQGRSGVVLHYAGIAAKELTETDSVRLEQIATEKREIEIALDMTEAGIILEATRLLAGTNT